MIQNVKIQKRLLFGSGRSQRSQDVVEHSWEGCSVAAMVIFRLGFAWDVPISEGRMGVQRAPLSLTLC